MKKIPSSAEGFLKTQTLSHLPKDKRVLLIRKGNELFNQKHYQKAKRIFMTAHYVDGLIRLGDYYLQQNNFLEALRMFYIAGENNKTSAMTQKIALVIKKWLKEDELITSKHPSPM